MCEVLDEPRNRYENCAPPERGFTEHHAYKHLAPMERKPQTPYDLKHLLHFKVESTNEKWQMRNGKSALCFQPPKSRTVLDRQECLSYLARSM